MARRKAKDVINLGADGYMCMHCGQKFIPNPGAKRVECVNSMCPGKASKASPVQPSSKEQE